MKLLLLVCSKIEAQNCKVSGNNGTFRSITLNENEVLSDISPNSGIKVVIFKGSNLHSIPSKIFLSYENLERLDLESQKIKEIKENSLTNAESLIYLGLQENKI